MPADHRREISVALALAALWILVAFRAPGYFTAANQVDIALANMPVLIVALGMTLVIIAAQIDISVGSMFAICSVSAGLFARAGLPLPIVALAACMTGAILGAINGAL